LKYADPISGAVLDIPASFIIPSNVYYMSYVAGDFLLSTTAPPSSQTLVEYSNPNPVSILQAVGGVAANQGETWAPIEDPVGSGTYRGWTLTEIMNRIFYPYQSPIFTSFAMQSQPTVLEVGDTLTGGVRSFSFSFNNTNVEPNTLDIIDVTAGNVVLNNPSLPITSPQSVDIGPSITKIIAASYQWKASAFSSASDPTGSSIFYSSTFHHITLYHTIQCHFLS